MGGSLCKTLVTLRLGEKTRSLARPLGCHCFAGICSLLPVWVCPGLLLLLGSAWLAWLAWPAWLAWTVVLPTAYAPFRSGSRVVHMSPCGSVILAPPRTGVVCPTLRAHSNSVGLAEFCLLRLVRVSASMVNVLGFYPLAQRLRYIMVCSRDPPPWLILNQSIN